MIKILISLLCLCFHLSLMSLPIGDITFISEGELLLETNEYSSYIYTYEDRLIVQGQYKIEEFLLLPDGGLERIGMFEIKDNLRAIINGSKYYNISVDSFSDGYDAITVFDLTQVPMVPIISFQIPYRSYDIAFTDRYLIIPKRINNRLQLLNKETYDVEREILGFDTIKILYHNSHLYMIEAVGASARLRTYQILDEDEFQMQFLGEIDVGIFNWYFDIFEDKLIITGASGISIYDISDDPTPQFLYDIPNENPDTQIIHAIIRDNMVYTSNNLGSLYVYEISDQGEITLIYSERELFWIDNNNLAINYPYLYMAKRSFIGVYDIENNFTNVFAYGYGFDTSSRYPGENDIYISVTDVAEFLYSSPNRSKHIIFSVLENNTYTITYETETLELITGVNIKNDLLYAFVNKLDVGKFLNIFSLQESEPILVSTTALDESVFSFYVLGDNIFFSDALQSTSVYRLTDNYTLSYVDQFEGIYRYTQKYLIALINNSLIFRDIDDYSYIITQLPLNLSNYRLNSVDDNNILILSNHNTDTHRIYSYDLDNNQLYLIRTLYGIDDPRSYNNIISQNAYWSSVSEYYSFFNGQLHKIGEKNENTSVYDTHFFPEINKMVHIAYSGVRIHDFDYKTVSDNDIVDNISTTTLLSNYPNPFNPSTTIRWQVVGGRGQNYPAHRISIDIYNIKGQKVRSLVNDTYRAGTHEIIWNGVDDSGKAVSSGLYFYRLMTDDAVVTRKMVLMK